MTTAQLPVWGQMNNFQQNMYQNYELTKTQSYNQPYTHDTYWEYMNHSHESHAPSIQPSPPSLVTNYTQRTSMAICSARMLNTQPVN